MKTKTKILNFILLLLVTVLAVNCVDTITNNPSEKPTINITSPKSGDTVQVGQNQITYSASDYSGGSGLDHYEIFIEGTSAGVVAQNDDGTNPDLYLTVDSTYLGKKISFYVSVYNKSGQYSTSSTISNLYVALRINAPTKPQNVSLEVVSDTEILLFWSDTTGTANYYEVWRKDGDAGAYKAIKTNINPGGSTEFSYRDVGLSPFIVYYYKIRAVNEIGGTFSDEVNTLNSGAPTNLTAVANGATVVSLNWTENSLNENGIRVERKIAGGTYETIDILQPNSSSYIDRNLSASTTYVYRVAAFTDNAIAYSNEATVTTYTSDIPAPADLVATFDSYYNAVDVSWTDNTALENGTRIERKEGAAGEYFQIGSSATDINTFRDYNIEVGKIYYYRARHTTTEGFLTEYSNEDSAYVPVVPPNPPTNLRITATSDTKIFLLDWVDNASDEDGYELWAKKEYTGTWALFDTYPANQIADSIKISDPTKEYFFKIRSFRGSLNSGFSNEVSTKGTATGFVLASVSITSTAVQLQWRDVFEGEVLFVIERKKTSFPADSDFVEIGTATAVPGAIGYQTYTDTDGIASFDSYLYRVRAKFTNGYSDYSNELPVTIP